MQNEIVQDISADLGNLIRGDIYSDMLHRIAYSSDASIYQIIPDCVVAPKDSQDVIALVKYAHINRIPVAPRGAASGLAGESLTSGIILDMKRYMNKIMSIENDGELVVCEPGVVLDNLNNALARYSRKIGPLPSSSNRATVGGCVANNATGEHSLAYGYISDYVESIEAVLANGDLVEFKNDFKPAQVDGEAIDMIAEKCRQLLTANRSIIENSLPKTKRNRSGYNIAGICHNEKIDLARLVAGSEGTLAVFTKIKLRTVPIPTSKALLQLEFDSLDKMAKAVPIIVDSGASACELMGKNVTDMVLEALPEYADVLPGGENTVVSLLVEQTGQTPEQVKDKIKSTDIIVGELASRREILFDNQSQEKLWKSRKDAVPLLFRRKSKKRPIPFIEDISVDNKQLGKYLEALQQIALQYDFEMAYYGHAGDGLIHVRPYLDLKDPNDVEKMLAIANDVFSIAWSLGGTISGEHANGLVRAAFIKNQYGEQFYEILRQVKNIFDPDEILNPGKIINDDTDIMTKNLRTRYDILPDRLETDLHFGEDEFELELAQCNGCGLCVNTSEELRFCPVYRALNEELASSRAKANVLYSWATGQLTDKDFESPEFRKFLDLCVNCKACSIECPSGVDISKLMTTARARHAKQKKLRKTDAILSRNRYLNIMGSSFSSVSNFANKLEFFKWLLEKTSGIDKRRQIPKFADQSFLTAGNKYLESLNKFTDPVDMTAYFVDSYVNYNDHELGFAVIDTLRNNNIEVILPKQRPAPLPAIYYGDVKTARKDLSFSIKYMAQAIRKGYKIICSEPSAALCLKEELRHFVVGDDAKLVSKNSFELMSYLLDLFKKEKLKNISKPVSEKFLYHLPCHLYAAGKKNASIELLKSLCKAKVTELNAGCCGIAGTFGMQKKNYELSSRIAEQLKKALEKSVVKHVLTECSACKMQIEHISDKIVSHPIKILAGCYE